MEEHYATDVGFAGVRIPPRVLLQAGLLVQFLRTASEPGQGRMGYLPSGKATGCLPVKGGSSPLYLVSGDGKSLATTNEQSCIYG